LSVPQFRSLIDLGTASVKALVVESGSEQVHLWGHGEATLEGGYGPDGEIVDREAVAAACDAALSAAEDMTPSTFGHKIVPDRSLWGLPGWLCRGQAFALKRRRPKPTKGISGREWQVLEARLDRLVEGLPGVPVDVIPTAQVNGNTVTDILGLRGGTLTLRAFVVLADAEALATLRSVAAALELDPPRFTSQARAATSGLGADGVLLDVGRWGTAVVVAHLGQPAAMCWVPLGGQSFYRTLSAGFGLSPSQLSAFCQAYAEGWSPPKTKLAADAALVDPVNRWLDLVAERLSGLAAKEPLPYQVFLAGGASLLPAVLQGARRYDWMHQFTWVRHPEIHPWQAATVRSLVDQTDCGWGPSDLVRLGLARLALHI
jgi:hypothetical protein